MKESNPISASLNIDAEYVKNEVTQIVRAAIVSALGNRDEIIRKAIDSTIGSWVNGRGEPCRERDYNARPYLDYLAQKTVEKTVREAMEEIINENKDEFKAAIKHQLNTKKWKENTAQSFIDYILSSARNEWKMPVSVSFEKPKDY